MSSIQMPKVNSRYGAPMGRGNMHASDNKAPYKFYLRRVPLDSGGYDNGGAYWGLGQPLYMAETETTDDEAVFYFRASSRDDAKRQVREQYPNARFFR